MTIPNADSIAATLTDLQATIHGMNELKGFHEDRPTDPTNLAQWQGNKLLLIVSEVVEAHDEIRNGRAADETYYATIPEQHPFAPFKPEGVPSEIADVVIRCFDFAGTEGFDLGNIILEKLRFNSGRPYRHGKAF